MCYGISVVYMLIFLIYYKHLHWPNIALNFKGMKYFYSDAIVKDFEVELLVNIQKIQDPVRNRQHSHPRLTYKGNHF